MNKYLDLFYPSKKKLIVFAFIILASSFILFGNLVGNITTYNQDWPQWISSLMMVWSLTSMIGGVFQGPVVFFVQFLPEVSELVSDTLLIILALINSYIQGSLIGATWETKKTEQEKKYLKFYSVGIVFTFLGLLLMSVSESSNNFLLLAGGALYILLIVYFTKRFASKIFKPILFLTLLYTVGGFGFAIVDFEESYCWNQKTGPGLEYSDHLDCHKKFDLIRAIKSTMVL